MKEELLYLFIQGLTTPEESRDVIHWIDASPENLQRLLKEKELQDVLIWSLRADEPELPLEDFLTILKLLAASSEESPIPARKKLMR